MTPLLSFVVYMAIVTWSSLLAASLIRAEGWTLDGFPGVRKMAVLSALGCRSYRRLIKT